MRTFRFVPALIACLLAIPASAREAPKLTKETLVGEWQGVMVVVMKGETHNVPMTVTFDAAGQAKLQSPFEKEETQTWVLDPKAGTVTFKKKDGKTDMVFRSIALAVGGAQGSTVSMKAAMTPGDKTEMPDGMSVTLYVARLPKKP